MALAMPELEKQWRSARDLRRRGARPHGRRGHQRPRPAPAWRPTARARAHFLITSWRCAWHCPTRLLPPDSRASVERAMTLRATSPSRGLMRSLRTPGSRRPRPPPATGPRDRSHRPAAAVRRVHCCHCATDCAGATRLRGLGAAAVAGPLTLRRPLLRAAWGVRGGARGAQRPPWHVFSARSSLEAMRPCGAWQLACSALDAENGIIKKVCILEKFSRLFCSSALRACIHACMQGHVLRDRSGAKGKRGCIDLAPVLERSKRQTTYQHSLENNVQHVYGHVHVVRGRLWCPGLMPRAGHCQILSAGIQDLVLVAPYKGSRRRPPGRNLGKEGMKPDAGVLSGMRACHLSHPARARVNKDGMPA